MNGKEKIRQALHLIWDAGVVNATHIYKVNGNKSHPDTAGWYVQRFGENAQRFGDTINEVLEEITNRHLEQEKIKEELRADGVWQSYTVI